MQFGSTGFPNIFAAKEFSNRKLDALRLALDPYKDELSRVLIGTNGSFARREASDQSDLDFFVVSCEGADDVRVEGALSRVRPELIKIAGRNPSEGGAFGRIEQLSTMLTNIGGNDDLNQKITRRILLLLEGEWLHNEKLLAHCRSALLARYIRPEITSHQLALFLLNDIIRYYRTICVDFEFKTFEDDKDWGIRNIKLVFSRKLLYFSGVLVVAETMQRSGEEKNRIVLELLSKPVIDRVLAVCGDQALNALKLYDQYLGEIAQESVRKGLEKTKESDRTTEPFRRLKDEGHHFSLRLMSLFRQTYDISHPIHRLIFL